MMVFTDLRLRLLSAAALSGVLFGALSFGAWGMRALLLAAACGMTYEWLRVSGYTRKSYFFISILVITLPLAVVMLREPLLALGILCFLVSGLVFLREIYGRSLLKVALGSFVIGLMILSAFSILLVCQSGFFMMIWLILIVVSSDNGGYFFGRWLGGPRLAPRISPGKTWSGVIGGIVMALLVAVIAYTYYFDRTLPAPILGRIVFLAVAGVAGDLLESWFKRLHGVKNSGRLLPGHGGILDRCDSYLVAVPALYLLVYFDRYFMVSFGEFEKVL